MRVVALLALAPLVASCSEDSGRAKCAEADKVKVAILNHAIDAGVAGPCSPKEGGVVLPDFAEECAEYQKLAQLCCQMSGKHCI